MNPFKKASQVETEAFRVLMPYAEMFCEHGTLVQTHGQLFAQKYIGDMIGKSKSTGNAVSIEVKAEQDDATGNLFLESWSNRAHFTHGWMHTSQAEMLWYYFVGPQKLYTCELDKLKQWAFAHNKNRSGFSNVSRFPERVQSKYMQSNDTWGWCVPVTVLLEEVPGFSGPIDPVEAVKKNIARN